MTSTPVEILIGSHARPRLKKAPSDLVCEVLIGRFVWGNDSILEERQGLIHLGHDQ